MLLDLMYSRDKARVILVGLGGGGGAGHFLSSQLTISLSGFVDKLFMTFYWFLNLRTF